MSKDNRSPAVRVLDSHIENEIANLPTKIDALQNFLVENIQIIEVYEELSKGYTKSLETINSIQNMLEDLGVGSSSSTSALSQILTIEDIFERARAIIKDIEEAETEAETEEEAETEGEEPSEPGE